MGKAPFKAQAFVRNASENALPCLSCFLSLQIQMTPKHVTCVRLKDRGNVCE
uniref:Uncharacterized protein n=1 Tax=Anguilla anguilla TaxID=7936 RepID=A0A0E9WQC3_ANGAN